MRFFIPCVLVAQVATSLGCVTTTTAPESTRPQYRALFDGSTSHGWRGFKAAAFPEKVWSVVDGTLKSAKGGDVDLVTEQQYADFELVLEFRLTEGGNSGIKYLVDESLVIGGRHGLAFEYQIIDDQKHPDAALGRPGTRTCGALYDLIAPGAGRKVNPPGQWNEARLVVDGARIEHWLNGVKVVEFQRASPELATLIAGSKYKGVADFGQRARGHVLLQAHGDEAAFRNIRIRELHPPAVASVTPSH